MRKRVKLPFGGPYHEGRSSFVSDMLASNMYPRMEHKSARSDIVMYPAPGLASFGTGGTGGCRGNGVTFNRKGYMVNGSALLEIDQNDTITSVGTLNTTSGPVSMAAGFSYLMVTDGTNGYTWDGTTFATITDTDFPVSDYCAWSGQYFVVNQQNTGNFYISGLDDPTSWAALDFANAEKRADYLLRPIEFNGDLLLIGETTAELYQNTGNQTFPWEPYPKAMFEVGTIAPNSVATEGPTMFMLAQSREGGHFVIRASSETPTVVSDRDIEWQISQLSSISDARGFAYKIHGHTFYQLNFLSAEKTFVFDDTMQAWHERTHYTRTHSPIGGHLFYNNKHIAGDYSNNDFYTIEPEVYQDNGTLIERVCRSAPIFDNQQILSHARLELLFETGVGLATGQGSNPVVMVRWSDDGGNTWSNEHWVTMGKIGEYSWRVRLNKLGAAVSRIYEWKVTDPVKVVFIGAYADIEAGVI